MLSRTVRFASLVLAGEFAGLRERWDRLHALRVVLDVVGLGFLIRSAGGAPAMTAPHGLR